MIRKINALKVRQNLGQLLEEVLGESAGCLHERALWTRSPERAGDAFTRGSWSSTRLEP
jgi:hypothetical protein